MDEENVVGAAGGGHGLFSRRGHSQLSFGPIIITAAINNSNHKRISSHRLVSFGA
jgi:hypothetical protein